MDKEKRFFEIVTGIVQRDFDETSDFYKERYDSIYKQMLVCKTFDYDGNLEKYKYGPFQCVDFVESLCLSAQFLGSLDESFEKKFWDDIKNRNILINDEVNTGGFDYENNKIYVNNSSTIVDCFALVHEYIHKLSANLEKNDTISDNFFAYTEVLSILSEFMLRDFLVDLGYSNYDCRLFTDLRKECFNGELQSILTISPLFKLLEDEKSITKEGADRLKEDSIYSNKNVFVFSKFYPGIHYNYAFSTVVASNLYENNISKEKYVELIKSFTDSA